MNLIYDIIKKLTKQEIRQVKHLIRNSPFEYEKLGKLLELVTRYDEREESFYSQKVYGKEPDNTFRVTKSRLKRVLENIILNDKSLSSYNAAVTNARLQVKKKLLQGEILLGRGAYLASKNILLQVISTAKKYDLHEEHFQASLLLYRNHSIRTSVKEFKKQTAELLEYNQLSSDVNEGMILYYSISNLLANQALKPEEKEDVRKTVERLKEINNRTGHPQIQKLYYLSEIYFLQIDNRDDEALTFCHRYLELIKKEKSLNTEQSLAAAHGHLAQVYLRLGKLKEAGEYSDKILAAFSKEEMNYLQALELRFRINFYGNNYEEAFKQVEKAFAHPQFEASKMLAAGWHYFHACILFKTKQFQASYQKLNDTTPLLADKYGMNLHIRLLEIMIMFELGHLDLMETKILNMRQFIKRTQKNQELERPITLIKILIKWYRKSYDFQSTLEHVGPELAVLESLEKEKTFLNSNFELIRLEHWMKDRV